MIKSYQTILPKIHPSSILFEGSIVIGDVTIKEKVGIWYNSVIRGDMAPIVIEEGTNIQDGTIIHTNTNLPTLIGKNVTIGHRCIIHAAIIHDRALIGMGSILLDGSVIESEAMVAAGTVVPPNKVVKSRTLVMGNPMKVMRTLTEHDLENMKKNNTYYMTLLSQENHG